MASANRAAGRPSAPVSQPPATPPADPAPPATGLDDHDLRVTLAASPAAKAAEERTWQQPLARYGYLGAVGAITFLLDQLTKELVKRTMQLGEVIPVFPPVLDLHYITNRGVAFGLFPQLGDVFIPIALVIMVVIFGYYRTLRQRRLWLRTALGLQLGGALGNLVDRLRYGSVVDFVDFHIDAINFHFAVFNVADSAITIGVIILLLCLTFQQER